jgi:6-pyruvoyltetrahydropterin/6-carboxytetrahydropterin synthase
MFRVTRKYQFAASHRLHAPGLGGEENERLYGKCNNPYGHGHNYELEISVRGPVDEATGYAVNTQALDALVTREILEPFGHRNLNADVEAFATAVPTAENIGAEICRRLKRDWRSAFPGRYPELEKIRIAETPRNIFEVTADEIQ